MGSQRHYRVSPEPATLTEACDIVDRVRARSTRVIFTMASSYSADLERLCDAWSLLAPLAEERHRIEWDLGYANPPSGDLDRILGPLLDLALRDDRVTASVRVRFNPRGDTSESTPRGTTALGYIQNEDWRGTLHMSLNREREAAEGMEISRIKRVRMEGFKETAEALGIDLGVVLRPEPGFEGDVIQVLSTSPDLDVRVLGRDPLGAQSVHMTPKEKVDALAAFKGYIDKRRLEVQDVNVTVGGNPEAARQLPPLGFAPLQPAAFEMSLGRFTDRSLLQPLEELCTGFHVVTSFEGIRGIDVRWIDLELTVRGSGVGVELGSKDFWDPKTVNQAQEILGLALEFVDEY